MEKKIGIRKRNWHELTVLFLFSRWRPDARENHKESQEAREAAEFQQDERREEDMGEWTHDQGGETGRTED